MIDHIIGTLISDLAKKGIAGVYNNIKRLQRVYGAHNDPNRSFLDEYVDLSLHDAERVFGSYVGVLTETLQDFLVSLRASNLPAQMIEMRLLDRDAPGTRNAFNNLFRMHFPNGTFDAEGRNYDGKQLYDTITAMMTESIRLQQSDSVRNFVTTRLASRLDSANIADAMLLELFAPKDPRCVP